MTYDNVNKPKHYIKQNPFSGDEYECLDVMLAVFGVETVKAFCICNAFKYLWRCNEKGREEDILKGEYYLNRFKDLMTFNIGVFKDVPEGSAECQCDCEECTCQKEIA